MKEQLVKSTDKIYDGINKCTSITVHETANEKIRANAQAHANLQSTGGARQASWHIQVDDVQAIRSHPDTAKCWHAGPAAADSIAVEICVNADGDYDTAFKRAAQVVRDLREKHNLNRSAIKQHADWSGKDCPAKMRLAGRWQEFLSLTDGAVNMSTMVSPFDGRLTQNHGDSGGYRGHKGMDIAPPKPGQTGMPVYAAFAGTVRKVHRTAKNGGKTSTWAPGRTGNGLLISNPDGEGNGYNHMKPVAGLSVGDKVEAGDLLGYNDKSGNQTAPHLHLEFWADWRNPNSDYDPQLAFRKFGIKPGSAPSTTATVKPQASKPKPKPKPSAPKPSGPKPTDYANLVADGDFGKVSVRALQILMTVIGKYSRAIDGQAGKHTWIAVQEWLKDLGYYKGVADGVFGSMSIRALQNFLQDKGHYPASKFLVDGKFGKETKRAWQKYLNTQNGK